MTGVSLQVRLEEATADLARCQVSADVAAILRVEGVQGVRGQCRRCPVAVLLVMRLGRSCEVWVEESGITALDFSRPREPATVDLPPAVSAFMDEFDEVRRWHEFAVTSP